MEMNSMGNPPNQMFPKVESCNILVKDVNNFFICRLCGGYLIEATGLIECTHTYCRSCIIQFIQKSPFCPICEVPVNKMKPVASLRPDSIMQRLVYKTVPSLFKNELSRRTQYWNNLETDDRTHSNDRFLSEEYYFDAEEPMSISLEYVEYIRANEDQLNEEKNSSKFKEGMLFEKLEEKITHKRYLQCPAALKIKHICKFIKLKYNLQKTQEVEILYDNTKLPNNFSLMDTAYRFSWNREKPMRLCFQIFERKIVEVPMVIEEEISDAYAPSKNDFVTNLPSVNNSNSTKTEEEPSLTPTPPLNNPNKNLKRKCEKLSISEAEIDEKGDSTSEFPKLELKIPRLSVNTFENCVDKVAKDEVKIIEPSTDSSCSPSDKQIKTPSNDSGTYSDDCVKYEQDIEEVNDDDDDDDDDVDRLHISQISDEEITLSEKSEEPKERLLDDTLDVNTKEVDKEEKFLDGDDSSMKKTKYKRKSKKSKHHHHRHHHHRHHERKKTARQATILHSPDTDIMKLKVKLNTIKPESKHRKQSRRKRKHSPEPNDFSSSSLSSRASSVTSSSPETNNSSRADEDSLLSHGSEVSVSAESTETNVFKESPIREAVSETPSIAIEEVSLKEIPSQTAKEKLLQMRAFRPKGIAVVKPEESDKKIVEVLKNDNINSTNNCSNNGNSSCDEKVPKLIAEKPPTAVLNPTTSSSITVSKITAAEKILMEQEKKLNSCNDDRPSLEITLVSEPAKNNVLPVSALTSDNNTRVKQPQRIMKPLPALVQLKKPNDATKTKSMSIIPCGANKSSPRPLMKSNSNVCKKLGIAGNDCFPIKADNIKQNVTISLSGGKHQRANELVSGALDLSGRPSSKILEKNFAHKNLAAVAATQVRCTPSASNSSSTTKKAYVHPYGALTTPLPSSTTSLSPNLAYTAVNSLASSFVENSKRLMQSFPKETAQAQFQLMFGGGLPFPATMPSPKHQKMYPTPSCTSPNMHTQIINLPVNTSTTTVTTTSNKQMNKMAASLPALNEIKIGPVSSTTLPSPTDGPQHKPVPNQNIRNIPNPSRLLRRQQPIGSVGPMMMSGASLHHHNNNALSSNNKSASAVPSISSRFSSPCSFSNFKKNGEKCLQMALPKTYMMDHSNSIMATK